MKYDKFLNITETTLQKYKFALQKNITSEYLQDVDIEIILNRTAKEVQFRFTKYILGREMDKIQFPLNWKESVKEAFYNWFNKKIKSISTKTRLHVWARTKLLYIWASLNADHPIHYTVYTVMEFYPKISMPEQEHYVKFERAREVK